MNADDLKRFCAESGDIRDFLHKPFSGGAWTYATNGHILLRVPRIDDVAEDNFAANCEKLFAKTPPPTSFIPVPAATMPPDVECDQCGGSGVIDGEGPDDDSLDCEWCSHTGKVKQRIGVQISDTFFDQGYLSILQGWQISPNGQEPAWIRNGEGVDGLLMPRVRI